MPYITRGWFNIEMSSYQCRKSHCGDKMILRPSYLHNGISYTGKMTYLYWIRALDSLSAITIDNAIYHINYAHHFVLLWSVVVVMEVNSLWPSDAIWYNRYGSTLAQVMACCLRAPSHYLNHCLLIIIKLQWHFSWAQFHMRLSRQSLKLTWKLLT